MLLIKERKDGWIFYINNFKNVRHENLVMIRSPIAWREKALQKS
jgi:hypothetical protein